MLTRGESLVYARIGAAPNSEAPEQAMISVKRPDIVKPKDLDSVMAPHLERLERFLSAESGYESQRKASFTSRHIGIWLRFGQKPCTIAEANTPTN